MGESGSCREPWANHGVSFSKCSVLIFGESLVVLPERDEILELEVDNMT